MNDYHALGKQREPPVKIKPAVSPAKERDGEVEKAESSSMNPVTEVQAFIIPHLRTVFPCNGRPSVPILEELII